MFAFVTLCNIFTVTKDINQKNFLKSFFDQKKNNLELIKMLLSEFLN